VWLTCRPGEEYNKDCLILKFSQQCRIIVWDSIYHNLKGPLIIWDTENWGRINGSTYIERII
ncbi:hypothetical protein HOY82DRAFT_462794, partial [Tuber indicum]